MAMMVLRTCQQVEGGLPADVKTKMFFNIIVDFGIGLVPFLGDIADAIFRANTKNAVILEEHLRKKGAKNLADAGRPRPAIDPSDPEEFERQEHSPPPQYSASPTNRSPTQRQGGNNQSPVAPVPHQQKSGGLFSGFGSKKNKQPDVEQGHSTLQKARQ